MNAIKVANVSVRSCHARWRVLALMGCAVWAASPSHGKTGPDRASPVSCRIEVDRGVLLADKPESAIVKVTLAAERVAPRERPPVNLALVLDRSGSMGGDKIVKAREAAIEAIRRLDSRDTVSVVIYDHEVETLVPAQPARNIEWIESRLRQVEARGNTALFGGVSQGASELRKHARDGLVNRLLLLSDGLANVGPASPEELGRLGAALMKEGVAVSTVGVGTDYNEDLMTRLSRESDGNSYFVENSSDLPRIFATELGEVLTVAASRVRLTVRFREGASPVELIGRDGRLSDGVVEVDFNQLYGGQEKYVLVRTEFAPGREGETRVLAEAEVTFESAVTRAGGQCMARGSVRFSRDALEIGRNRNVAVAAEYLRNNNARALDEAVKLADRGDRAQAAAVLRESAARLRAAASELKQPSLAADLDRQEERASEIETEGLKKSSRKAMVTDSYQIQMQQSKK
ncbi:MAG: VWA domain-containing protein [Kiritimatiellae bacterium]|nr:VWA domain-containing protein [Kiritimatiellia bacterium]